MNDPIDTAPIRAYLVQLQQRIVRELERIDGGRFASSNWQRPEGAQLRGSGTTCILEEGALFERAGVGFTQVSGDRLPPSASAAHPEVAGCGFDALGVSLVLHPRNPYVPTVHMNVRFFRARALEATQGEGAAWWFGGGMDLTPYYGFEEDARHFHSCCRDALLPFGTEYYGRFKR